MLAERSEACYLKKKNRLNLHEPVPRDLMLPQFPVSKTNDTPLTGKIETGSTMKQNRNG